MQHIANYCFFDAARAGADNLDKAKKLNGRWISMYQGTPEEYSLATVAPYLFDMTASVEFAKFFEREGWGKAWGALLSSEASLQQLKDHFVKFLFAKDEEGRELFFRFYDPRVMRVVLPEWDKPRVADFFKPVEYFLVEGDQPKVAIRLEHQNGKINILVQSSL